MVHIRRRGNGLFQLAPVGTRRCTGLRFAFEFEFSKASPFTGSSGVADIDGPAVHCRYAYAYYRDAFPGKRVQGY